jgi:hypothetical protein
MQVLHCGLHERKLVDVITRLNAVDIQPVVVKGWAVARLYPDPRLRPHGDIDVCVPAAHYAAARAALPDREFGDWVDLHDGFKDVFEREGTDEYFARSRPVTLGGARFAVLCPEDHLRLLCLHLLRHGALKPLWLCDVAVAVERRPADFDWDRVLGGRTREAEWIAATIVLARNLLEARIDDTPIGTRVPRVPRWLESSVLTRWGALLHFRSGTGRALTSPATVWREFTDRLDHPLEATIAVRGPLNDAPRWPFHMADTVRRAGLFVAHLPRNLKNRSAGQ